MTAGAITMNASNYYTVAEAAEKLQISKQAVYKRLSTDLKQGFMLIDGKKYIKSDVIDSLVNSKVDTTGFKIEKPNEQQKVEEELIKALKSHIESLEKQNERLNNQIERLQYALMTEQERVKELTLPPIRTAETEKKPVPVKEPIKAETHTEQTATKPLNSQGTTAVSQTSAPIQPVQKKTTAAVVQKTKTTSQTSTAELLKMRKPQPKKRKKFLDWLFN